MCVIWVSTHKLPTEDKHCKGGITFTRLYTPKGTRDYLPNEVKQYHYIEDQLKKTFKLWNYKEVRSPTIEFVETLSTGVGPELVDAMFKFQDFDGKILALRAEMTAPVARIVTTRMSSMPEPIRLFYLTNVFRYSQSYLKREREFLQAGVELVGCNTPEADGEILALLISSLKQVGLKDLRIDLGDASLLKELLDAAGLKKEKRDNIQSLLSCRDGGNLKKFMEENDFPSELREAFLQLSCCRKLDEVTSISLNPSKYGKASKNLENILGLQEILIDYRIDDMVFFDFSLTKEIEYYSGMVFEASVPNLGLPLGGGGRYDNFIEKFGKLKLPATGFALEIGKLLQALTVQGFKFPKEKKPKVVVTSKFRKIAVEAVEILREAGIIASLEIARRSLETTNGYGKIVGIDCVVSVGSSIKSPITVYDVKLGTSRNMTLKTFLKDFEGESQK
jgi:ATP phosphoribosyltransferase regulatory subunit